MAQEHRSRRRQMRMLAKRFGIDGSRAIVFGCVVLLLCVGAFGWHRLSQAQAFVIERGEDSKESMVEAAEESSEQASGQEPQTQSVLVHVDGAVTSPGVYLLTGPSPRINDAVVQAGGLTPEADTTAINLAAQVSDGQKIHVPAIGEEVHTVEPEALAADGASYSDEAASATLVNINTATSDELQTLTGIGEATASAIIKDRETNGPFSSPEDLMRVSGIGEKKFAKIKDGICV